MVLPLVKLGTLAVKTLSKPIANRLKKEAGNYPKFRLFIINIAQINHRFSTSLQRRLYSHATNVKIRPLDEEKAVQAAADLLGDVFVFLVAGGVLIFEVQRSARSESRKEEARKQELQALKDKDADLAREVEDLKRKINEVESLARGRGLTGILNLKQGMVSESSKPVAAA
ncbi:OPA3-like protein [Dioscorea cayenensis subsp. rotundata]|uniref:OPA3-like protein n=1 Tax=Dioscorea cayennensis subsp. rotundata TaxID=55577 RepID=A0AB40B2D7_DIOCR|nr:OPA3-like protein [Dioscorea cayenensis subsp. rotundata]